MNREIVIVKEQEICSILLGLIVFLDKKWRSGICVCFECKYFDLSSILWK